MSIAEKATAYRKDTIMNELSLAKWSIIHLTRLDNLWLYNEQLLDVVLEKGEYLDIIYKNVRILFTT